MYRNFLCLTGGLSHLFRTFATKIKLHHMRKALLVLIAFLPMTLWAQDNTWEQPEEETTEKEAKVKVNKDAKYLKGAVPEVDGKIVFSTTIKAPGKSADQIFNIVRNYMQKMTTEKNQLDSKLVVNDSVKHEVAGYYDEWLVFRKTAIILDRTQFIYALSASCKKGQVDLSISRIRYLYGEGKDQKRYTAEEWISDKEAVNKKNTRLYPLSGKFRRKTVDRKDFLFNKFESLLK